MQISKSRFLNLIRCNRFAALDEIYRNRDQALVTFDPDSMDSIYAEETHYKKLEALQSMFQAKNENGEFNLDDLDNDDEYLDLIRDDTPNTFQDDFDKIELLAARALKNLYGGEIIAGKSIADQKHFEANYEGHKFHCFLDVYLETETEIIVCEVKASTSRAILEKGGKSPLFQKYGDIYYRNHEKETDCKKVDEEVFKDPFHDLGRMTYDLTFQRFVIEESQEQIKKPIRYFLALLNSQYTYDGKKQNDGTPQYNDNIISFFDLTKLTEEIMPSLGFNVLKAIDRLNDSNLSVVSIGKHCMLKKTRECPFYSTNCQIDHDIPQYNSILNFINSQHGFLMPGDTDKTKSNRFDLIDLGYTKITDFELDNLTYPQQKIQYHAVKDHQRYIDYENILKGINMIKYPIYHLDFETFASPLPRFAGEKCYTQSAFQYSLHIERAPGVCDEDLDHFEYLVKNHQVDERKQLFYSLFSKLSDPNGMILAYNVSFEKSVIRKYLEIDDTFANQIKPLVDEAFDLMDLVKGRSALFPENTTPNRILFYDEALNGSYSIKKVLPVFAPKLTYQDLEVKKGTDAVLEFSKLYNMSIDEYQKKINALLAYCKRDTWAMVVILDKLREIANHKSILRINN